MSSTRNKRKRAETDSRSVGRPKSREQRDAAAPSGKKNEGPKTAVNTKNNISDTSKASPGTSKQVDSSTVATRQHQAIVQDASPKSRRVVIGDGSLSVAKNLSSRQKGSLSPNSSNGASAANPLHPSGSTSSGDPSEGGMAKEMGRAERLKGLISHRSSLRTRIRYCAAAAIERLREEIGESGDSQLDLSTLKSGDTNEVSVFVEMTNSATVTAKRIRSESEANNDRRTSLSLRRGSSVGKRMNAALSSLAPGSSTSHSPSNFSTVEIKKEVLLNEKDKEAVDSNMPENAQVQSAFSMQQTLPPSNGLVQPTNSSNVNSNTIPSQRRQSKQDKPILQGLKVTDGNNIDGKGPAANSIYSDVQAATNRQSSSTDSNRLALPMHLRVVTDSLPQNKLSGRGMFSTKTTVLRKQRDAIEAKLHTYREQTRQKAKSATAKNGSFQRRSLQRQKTVSLPHRKITHWDTLLQELSWMATDFIEERKWKASASRSLSAAVLGPSEIFPSSTRLPCADDNIKRLDVASRDTTKQSIQRSAESGIGTGSELESTSTCSKLKEISLQTYPPNGPQEDELSRNAGRHVAFIITKIETAVMETIEKKKFHVNDDHLTIRNPRDTSRLKERILHLSPHNENLVSEGFIAKSSQQRFSFLEISARIDFFEKITKEQGNRENPKTDDSKFSSLSKTRLSKEQKDVLDRIANLWSQPIPPGIALSGTPFCGMTHTVSSLIWQKRMQGPQLVLCTTNSTARWKHEIEKFDDVRVLNFGLSERLSELVSGGSVVMPKAGDIIVCEFDLVDDIITYFGMSDDSLAAIIVDCRYPSSFYSAPDKLAPDSVLTNNSPISFDGFAELLSTLWWEKLLALSLRSSAAALLIEHTGGSHFWQNHSNLSPRAKLEIAASRAAVLIGPCFFLCEGERIQRRVLSWARHHGKLEGKRKSAEAIGAIEKAIKCFAVSLPSPGWSNESMGWELRRCKMGDIQRSNYDDCCIQVRGALGCRLAELVARNHDALDSVSASLMLLRQQCIHYDMVGKHSDSSISMPSCNAENPSQLDSALALSLIKGSAKLEELVSILKFKCGVNIGESLMTACHLAEPKMEECANRPRKVAILATLPIARRIVSLLLNALGIQHELLHSTSSQELVTHSRTHGSVFPSQCQQSLPFFNGWRRRGPSQSLLTDIIVASPICLSGRNQGLRFENAETVILLDEDWTGRGELQLRVLMSRIQAHNFHNRKRCDFVRLICEDTIEEKIFSTGSHEFGFVESQRWPRDKAGFITLPETKSEALEYYKTASNPGMIDASVFPLLRVTRLRHEFLANILLPSRTIPLELGSASEIRFLPFAHLGGRNDDTEIKSELELIRVLCHDESVASVHSFFESNAKRHSNGRYGKRLFLPASRTTGVFRPLATNRQKFLVCSYLPSLLPSNTEQVESTRAQGHNIMHVSSDHSRSAAAISAPHLPGAKVVKSRTKLLDSSPMPNDSLKFTSTLHYAPPKQRDQHKVVSIPHGTNQGQQAIERSITWQEPPNCYSKLYANIFFCGDTCDGGLEPLLYFPPLLNGMQREMNKSCQSSTSDENKRKAPPIPAFEIPNSKRAKEAAVSPPFISQNQDDSNAHFIPNAEDNGLSTDVQHSRFTQNLNVVPKQPAPIETSNGLTQLNGMKLVTGTATIPGSLTTLHQKTVVSRECRVYPLFDISEIAENFRPRSPGRSGSHLDSVILFVKKQRMQNPGSMGVSSYDSNITKHPAATQVPALAAFGGEKFGNKVAEDTDSKNKKASQENLLQPQLLVQATSVHKIHSTQATTNQATDASKKLGHRHRLHDFFVSRSLASGLSMFECVPYQAVVSQIEIRVALALEKRQLFFDCEKGIFASLQQFEIDASRTPNGHRKNPGREVVVGPSNPKNNGDGNRALTKCNLFGPRGGFLSSLKGVNAPSIQKQPLGVSLPMGVKVSQAREEAEHSVWSQNANSLLCNMVSRYGQNWILIAKLIQQILKVELSKNQYRKTSENLWWKSAELCQSRWQRICETSQTPSTNWGGSGCDRRLISTRHGGVEQKFQGMACRSVRRSRDSPVLVGRTSMMEALNLAAKRGNESAHTAQGQSPIDENKEAPQRSANLVFSSLITSNVQRRLMPIAIIGVGNGPKQNQTAHSHPSHMQSVQESVTSHWSDGRTELWPLQILDAAEKQYATSRTPSAPPKPGSHPHIPSSTSSSHLPARAHGNPYPRVPGNAAASTHPAPKPGLSPRMSGQTSMGSASIAPKKPVPQNNVLARNNGKPNSKSK